MALKLTARGGFEEEPYPDAMAYAFRPESGQDFLSTREALRLGRLAATPRGGDGVMVVISGVLSAANREHTGRY